MSVFCVPRKVRKTVCNERDENGDFKQLRCQIRLCMEPKFRTVVNKERSKEKGEIRRIFFLSKRIKECWL